jgi:hypothetical protein
MRNAAVFYRRRMSKTLKLIKMKPLDLEPSYTHGELPGKCIKCLAEHELDGCLREMLRGENNKEIRRRFQMLVTFLKSPESQRLRDEAEKHLSDGKRVKLRLAFVDGKPKYELNIEQEE